MSLILVLKCFITTLTLKLLTNYHCMSKTKGMKSDESAINLVFVFNTPYFTLYNEKVIISKAI